MNEFDFEIEYIKGKENTVADFLSRVEINCVDNDDVRSDLATIHSGKENLNDHIYITETPVNIYKHQLILESRKSNSHTTKFLYKKKRRTIINLTSYSEEFVLNILKGLFPLKGTVGLYCKDDNMFINFQKTIVKYFSNAPNFKILRCTKFLSDITCKEKLLELIEKTHFAKNHRGIDECFLELKDTYYYPNLRLEVHKYINSCIFCNMCKYDRNPIKPMLMTSETPNKPNEIVHTDIWFLNKHNMFLTFIDKLTKHASIHPIADRNSITIVEVLKHRFATLGKPVKIVADNEFNTTYIKKLFKS